MSPTNVAVIGAGVIGRTLATRFAQAGHRVTFGSRNPDNAELTEIAGGIGAGVDTVPAAIEGADVVVWAIGGGAMAEAVPAVAPQLEGKTVIDATNNVGAATINSLGVLAKAAPTARLYRAFNSLGWENFADGHYGELTGDMLYSGPPERKDTVEELIGATDLRPIWVGDNDKAKVVDDFVTLWFTLAFERGFGRDVGFKILTR
jgi:8-hydroxy-5-deazaflavin:NADPH oxidoreductase